MINHFAEGTIQIWTTDNEISIDYNYSKNCGPKKFFGKPLANHVSQKRVTLVQRL